MWRLALSGVLAERRRLAAVVTAVVLAVGLFVATQVLTASLAEVSRVANRTTSERVDVLVRADSVGVVSVRHYRTMPAGLADRLRAVPGVAAVDGQVVGYARLVDRDGDLLDSGAAGQHLVRSWSRAPVQDPYRLAAGSAPTRPDQLVLDANLAGRAGLRVGDRVRVVSAAPTTEFTVSGIVRFGTRAAAPDVAALFTTGPAAQRLTGAGDGVHRIQLTAAAGTSPEQLADRVRRVTGGGVEVLTGAAWRAEQDAAADGDIAGYRPLLTLFTLLALALGVFVIANACTVLAAQRTRESALLRAVGATPRQVARRLRTEAAVAGLVGSVLGVPVGLAVAVGLQRLLERLRLAVAVDRVAVPPATLLAALALGMLTAVAGSALPARRSARTRPAAALRDAALEDGGSDRARTAGVLAGAAALAVVAGRVADSGPVVAVGVLGACAATVLAGPLLVRRTGRMLGWAAAAAGGAPGELAGIATARTPRRTAAAALAVAAAVAVTAFVLTVAATLLATFSGTVRAQFRGDVAVLPAGYTSGQAPGLPRDVPRRVTAAAPGATALTISTAAPYEAAEPLDRVGGASDPRLLQRLFDLGTVTGDLAALGPGTAAAHGRVARDRGWRIGDTVPVDLPGGPREYRLVAVFTGLGDEAPLGGVLLTRQALLAAEPSADTTGVYLATDAPAATRTRLASALADTPLADVLDRDGYVRANEGDFRRILAAVRVLLALAGAVSLVGVANTLLLSVTERAPELARLRAIGMTPRQLRTMLRWEAVAATLLGVVLGLALGALAAAALLPVLSPDLRLTLPVGTLAALAAAGALIGPALAVPAVRGAGRLRPATATT